MNRSTSRIAALIALMAAFALLAPAAIADSEKAGDLVAVSCVVVGDQVLVKVTNPGTGSASGFVQVDGVALGFPVRSGATVTVRPGATATVSVGFAVPLTGVDEVWIIDSADPVQ